MKAYKSDNDSDDRAKMQTTSFVPYRSETKYLEKVHDITLDEATLNYGHAIESWTEELDNELKVMFNDDITLKDIANHFALTVEQVMGRMEKLLDVGE